MPAIPPCGSSGAGTMHTACRRAQGTVTIAMCEPRAAVTACFAQVYTEHALTSLRVPTHMQTSGFLSDWVQAPAGYSYQASGVVSLLSPAEASLGSHAAGGTVKTYRDNQPEPNTSPVGSETSVEQDYLCLFNAKLMLSA